MDARKFESGKLYYLTFASSLTLVLEPSIFDYILALNKDNCGVESIKNYYYTTKQTGQKINNFVIGRNAPAKLKPMHKNRLVFRPLCSINPAKLKLIITF